MMAVRILFSTALLQIEANFLNLVIIIRNSRLILGCVDKSVLGANGKTNVFYMLLRDCSEAAAALAMARLARLTSYYLSTIIVLITR